MFLLANISFNACFYDIEEALRLGAADLWKQIQTHGYREADTDRESETQRQRHRHKHSDSVSESATVIASPCLTTCVTAFYVSLNNPEMQSCWFQKRGLDRYRRSEPRLKTVLHSLNAFWQSCWAALGWLRMWYWRVFAKSWWSCWQRNGSEIWEYWWSVAVSGRPSHSNRKNRSCIENQWRGIKFLC